MILLRSLLFMIAFYAWSVVMALAMLPTVIGPRRWMIACFRFWGRGIYLMLALICGIRVEIRGRHLIPQGAALVAPKHQCMFDVFSQFVWLPDSCWVMKKELMWIPFFGWYALKTQMIIVDREGGAAALKKMVSQALVRFADNRQLVIFPEGTRGEPGVAGDYKPGVAALYRELGVPCVPVATNSGVHWPAHGFLRKPGTIVFEFLEPIPPGLKRATFMDTLKTQIETASIALLAEGL
jgi:1-acyl-sn-glycerol-3-phosphate acyltransferase